jgi:hypothetical protein
MRMCLPLRVRHRRHHGYYIFVALTYDDGDDVTSNGFVNWNHVGIEQFHLLVVALHSLFVIIFLLLI